jgi:chromate reductase
MIEAKRPVRILGFAGSLRQRSYNRALLRAASELVPEDVLIEIFDLLQIPLYNADVEARGDPESVAAFKQAIRQADAVLMVTPEYNHGVPGVMKNAVDWASRPPRSAVLNAKPAAIIGASPGVTGTARGQSQLRQAFEFTNSYAMPHAPPAQIRTCAPSTRAGSNKSQVRRSASSNSPSRRRHAHFKGMRLAQVCEGHATATHRAACQACAGAT